jgi:hypothetical protein
MLPGGVVLLVAPTCTLAALEVLAPLRALPV